MTEIKTYCDHCGKELDDMKDYPNTEIDIIKFFNVDLCVDCMNELQKTVEQFIKLGFTYDGYSTDKGITHWMPLPEPPKER